MVQIWNRITGSLHFTSRRGFNSHWLCAYDIAARPHGYLEDSSRGWSFMVGPLCNSANTISPNRHTHSSWSAATALSCTPPLLPAHVLPPHISLRNTLEAVISEADVLLELYITVKIITEPTMAHSGGLCLEPNTPKAQGDASVYRGKVNPTNAALRVPGMPTNNHTELYTVLWILKYTSDCFTLYIFTDSTYIIHSTSHWAPHHAARG